MRHSSDRDRAESMFEIAMESVHGHVVNARSTTEQLGELIDEFIQEDKRDKADELIDRLLMYLDEID